MSERVWKTLLVISLIAYLWKFSQRWSHLFNWMQKLSNDVWLMTCVLIGTSFSRMPPTCLIRFALSPPSEAGHRGILTHVRRSYSLCLSRKPEPTFDLLGGKKKTRTKASNLSQPTPALSSKLSSSECLAHLIPEDLRQAGWKGPSIPWKEQNTNVAVDLL